MAPASESILDELDFFFQHSIQVLANNKQILCIEVYLRVIVSFSTICLDDSLGPTSSASSMF